MARRIIFIILGAIFAVGGLIYGVSSHSTPYSKVAQNTVAHRLSGDSGRGYIQMDNDSTNLYYMEESDFSPAIDANLFGKGSSISFIYAPNETLSIDVQSTNSSTHLQGTAYKIVEFVLFDSATPQEFVSSEYKNNPNGYNQNNWPGAIGVIVVGLVLLVLGFVMRTRKKQAGFAISPAGTMGMQPQANPYQQPYQNPAAYQQPMQQPYQQNPQYPGQYDATQAANPYNPSQTPNPYDPTQRSN